MGRRLDRVASLLKEEVSRVILYDLADPRMGFITVTRVVPAPDLQSAMVYLSVLGSDDQIKTTLKNLEKAHGYIQSLVSKKAILRYTPRLRFVYDKSVAEGVRISKMLRENTPGESPATPESDGEEE